MKTVKSLMLASVLSAALVPGIAQAQSSEPYQVRGSSSAERVLSASEINDLVSRAQQQGVNASAAGADVRYVGGSDIAIETNVCCENVEEQVTTRTEVQETTSTFEAVTHRDIIQPVHRTTIQPIERRIAVGRTETVTEDTRYEENRLPVRVERDPVPQVMETYTEQVQTNVQEERYETTYDVIGRREVIQPIVRTTVVPVQRQITRNLTDVVTNDTRYEQVIAPARVNRQAVPAMTESTSTQLTEDYREDVTETTVDYVAQRDIYQPVHTTTIQPVERQILRGTSETVTGETRYTEERLPVRVETIPAGAVEEVYIPQVSEQTVFEVEDVYIDQINRRIIQPVVITTIQPVENQVLQARTETITNGVVYEENRLPVRVDADQIPQTITNYIPQPTSDSRQEVFETYFDAVTSRQVIVPVVHTQIQPVEVRRPVARTETVTAPTQYETVRASMVVLNIGGGCNCSGGAF